MKALISAYACEPGRGSEPGVGWQVVRELSARHELWVLTRANHAAVILGSGEEWVGRVHWVFLDPPRWLTFWKKGGRGLRAYYWLWQRQAFQEARRLTAEHAFDVAHHLTFGNFLPPSPLADLGIPFACGPLGGGETMPPELFDGCDLRTKWQEWSREAARSLAVRLPWVRAAYRDAVCLAATPQTAALLRAAGARQVAVQPQSGLTAEEREHLSSISRRSRAPGEPLRLVAASRLIPWKGIDLAIEAVALAVARGIEVRLTVLQDGPERRCLGKLSRRLGVDRHIDFRGRLPSMDDVHREIAAADALIHPAWHEAFGQVCLEALAMGVPVICLDWCGPGRLVTPECGIKVVPGTRQQVIEGFARAILGLRGHAFGDSGKARARDSFSWDVIARRIEASWHQAAGA